MFAKQYITFYNKIMFVLLPIAIYIFLYVPYLYLLPGNDGGLEYMFAHQWYLGNNLLQILSLHPPFKVMLFSLFFKLFGYQSTGYIGLLFGVIGIYTMYQIGKKLFDEKVALISSILLATSGLFISNGIFGIHDFLMTIFILISFLFYLDKKYAYYAIFATLAVLTKETAIFFISSILIADILIKKNVSFFTFVPLVVLIWYVEFVHFSGYHLWNDWNFSSTAKDGSLLTMVNNIITLKLFNKYAYENWLHLFVFNFNWVYWIFALVSLLFIKTTELKKELAPIAIFFATFFITVLSFQTFTINRYILPLLPFVYLFAGFSVMKLRFKPVFVTLLIIVSFLSLSQSIDPLSNGIWQKTQILGERVYLNHPLDGDDGITYNMQYLTLMSQRNTLIKNGTCKLPHLVDYDKQELKLFKISSCQ
jgi:4-amino-4-deoxy-L-arabinose transferase-like glycosyltransferase